MARKLLVVASALLMGAVSMAPTFSTADEQMGAASLAAHRVPLPIARPAWTERMVASSDDRPAAARAGRDGGVAPAPDGSGLKSGSAEALAVQLEGARVLSSEGDVVGEVEKVIDKPGSGRQAVISVGGFLGIGGSRILLPAENLVPSGKGMVRTDLTEQQLKSLPAYDM